MKRSARILTLTVMMFVISGIWMVSAQTINEAGDKFNQGIELVKTDSYDEAIAAFEECIAICDQLGAEGAELGSRAADQIPDLHYKAGVALYKEKKITESIARLEKCAQVSQELGDPATLAKANKLIPQLVNAVGMSYYKEDAFDKAVEQFDKAIGIDPDYPKAYLGKALAMNKMDDIDGMREALRMAIEKGETKGDSKTVGTARELGYKGFLVQGQKALKAADYKSARDFLAEAASYNDEDANLHYLLAVTYNKLSNWDDAVTEGEKAVSMEEAPDKQAAAWFELGTAYEKKGDTVKACEAYNKALTGPNGAAAKYQIEQVLKCQ